MGTHGDGRKFPSRPLTSNNRAVSSLLETAFARCRNLADSKFFAPRAEITKPYPVSTRPHERTTTNDNEKMLRARKDTTTPTKTPIDGARQHAAAAVAAAAVRVG